MFEELQKLIDDLLDLEAFWGTEALVRPDEAGQQFAKGVAYGFKLVVAITETKKQK